MTWFILAGILLAVLLTFRQLGKPGISPQIGDLAPDFSLPDQHGALHVLGDFRGKWLVLYFFPRADTPG